MQLLRNEEVILFIEFFCTVRGSYFHAKLDDEQTHFRQSYPWGSIERIAKNKECIKFTSINTRFIIISQSAFLLRIER